ncbi:zebrafish testis-expressed 38 isoform X2 [Dicentrarchus labrax]|uniref:zebrafish testis-expressed 38 isoform X2 n=1 Tax=Dicentrarchus labrax TaxID=13489 RepID=UPI0021F593DB|nr:zebrafish testis-expressed 38 isoform X2 [Dicentrarchus labrax]
MAAGKMCIRNSKEETAEWTGLFLNDLKTEQKSLVFVKRMVAVAISSITYLRGIFPEDAYRSRYLEDLCIKVLREDCNNSGASKVVKWMMGCFDALEKQYLEIVFIGVYTNPDEPNCIIESYQFNFKYTEKGPKMDIIRNNDVEMQVTLEDTKRASVLLIRKLFLLMQNLDALPNNVYLNMKLYYYDDITPADYQPPGFKEGECDSLWFEGMAVHFTVGKVHSGFHTLRVRVSAEQSRLEKLQEGNHLRETRQVSQGNPPEREMIKEPCKKMHDQEDLPSEDGMSMCCYCEQKCNTHQRVYTVDSLSNRVCTVQETHTTFGKGTVALEA